MDAMATAMIGQPGSPVKADLNKRLERVTLNPEQRKLLAESEHGCISDATQCRVGPGERRYMDVPAG